MVSEVVRGKDGRVTVKNSKSGHRKIEASVKKVNGKKPETGRYSKHLDEFKDRAGLPKMEEVKELPITSLELLQKRITFHTFFLQSSETKPSTVKINL